MPYFSHFFPEKTITIAKPFPHLFPNNPPYFHPFTFTGKERDEETGYSYFGARYYDPEISGLFLSVDPLADKYPSFSPYAYCAWNPVRLVDSDGCSGVPTTNKKTKTITINAKLFFYGPNATPELSKRIANNIAFQWNSANATYDLNGITYKVVFKIQYETVSKERAKKVAENNKDKRNNFIYVCEGPDNKTSFTRGRENQYGGNSFWFNTKDDLEKSTTPSHEFGHGLGLSHTNGDFSSSDERPDIMIPRNTEYGHKWSVVNDEGVRVVNPYERRVTQKNVQDALDSSCGSVSNVIF
jgi:RHS repeat-associated protein